MKMYFYFQGEKIIPAALRGSGRQGSSRDFTCLQAQQPGFGEVPFPERAPPPAPRLALDRFVPARVPSGLLQELLGGFTAGVQTCTASRESTTVCVTQER